MHLDPRTMTVPAVAALTAAAMTAPAAAQQFQDQTATRFPAGPAEYTNYIAVGDIDDDGDLDLVFANGGNFGSAGPAQQVRVFINDGAGSSPTRASPARTARWATSAASRWATSTATAIWT